MSSFMIVRLWIMVFLHYFVWGSWYVTMGTYLTQTLQFEGGQVGLAYGSTAIGAIVSPFFAGIVADRFFATQKLLGTLHLIGAGLLYLVTMQETFNAFYPLLILYTVSYMAGHGLTNTLTLHHAVNPGKEFPIVMMAGSVGWIAAGLVNSGLQLEDNVGMFQLACGAAALMGLYSFTLPNTPPKGAGQKVSVRTMLGFDALKLMREPSFAMFIVCSFLICIPLSFYFAWMNVFLNELGIANAAAKMTIGQVSDVVFLLLLPVLLPVFRSKGILLVGMAAWALRFGLFAWFDTARDAHWMMYLGIAVHGMCYDFIFVMGRMYVDKRASADIRGAAQGLHAFVTLGIGMFVGSWLSGVVGEHYASQGADGAVTHNWQMIWAIPAVLSVVLTILFVVLFKDREPSVKELADGKN
ncbi:MAG: MFS transporter [Planctomycetota bacterium]|nr:MFS transporter [Planctomycetota bacterium]